MQAQVAALLEQPREVEEQSKEWQRFGWERYAHRSLHVCPHTTTPSPEHPHCHCRQIGDALYFRYFIAEGKMGNIPGGVPLGIFGDDEDQPWYPHAWACTDEYYGYQTSQFLWAALVLQDLEIA